jgi:hypothetical protein
MTKPYIIVSFRCSKNERRILREKATSLGLCLGAYLRAHAYVGKQHDPILNALPTTHQTDIEVHAHAQEQSTETATPDPSN